MVEKNTCCWAFCKGIVVSLIPCDRKIGVKLLEGGLGGDLLYSSIVSSSMDDEIAIENVSQIMK